MSYSLVPLHITPAAPSLDDLTPKFDLSVPLDQLIAEYRVLRDQKSDLNEKLVKDLEPIVKEMARLDDLIQRTLSFTGQTSAKTAAGTAYLTTKNSYTVSDPEAFRAWAKANPDAIALFSNSLAKESVEEFIKQANMLPPGVKVSSVQSLRVNKPTEAK